MFDLFQEIWSAVRKNKLRTFLTGFAVAWGIFLLIVLMATGNGLKNGMTENFRHMSSNLVYLWPGRTTTPYAGYQKNRQIKFKSGDVDYLDATLSPINLYAEEFHLHKAVSYGRNSTSLLLKGVNTKHLELENLNMLPGRGRFINEMDLRERRKVIVISPQFETVVFRDVDAVGKYVDVEGIPFLVIGVYDAPTWNQTPELFIPCATANFLYNKENRVHTITFSTQGLDTKQANENFDKQVRRQMARRHTFDANDQNAVWMWNTSEEALMILGIFSGIQLFMWVVGIGTLIAGIVGVSNIMLIAVRERTKEFGIRKAIGAKPWDIIKLVLIESVVITAIFGYVGMLAGIGVSELANSLMEQIRAQSGGEGNVPFRHPDVPLWMVISANALLIVAGMLAGYFPARKAVNVTAVEAMKD